MFLRRLIQPLVASLLVPLALAAQQPAVAPPTLPAAAPGRVTGRIVDRETGRPVPGARVTIVGSPGVVEADLDGRYRTPPLPAGRHSLRAAFIGYQPSLRDSVQVPAGSSVVVDFALSAQAVELEELQATVTIPAAPKTDAGLLAAQQAAPSVSDGISAEAMSRSPDSDGGEVIRRVTGITVFDKKFVVVRGLSERYSNTLLNGVDLPSPEPLKKVVPLDIFPASLLESIVATKTATPDRPGDFTGGSVEVRTKEFPENPVLQFNASQGFNTQSTFKTFAQGPRSFRDALGFGADSRRPLSAVFGQQIDERTMESFRNVWQGRPEKAMPNLGLGLNFGGQFGEARPFGYVLALTYDTKRTYTPDRLSAYYASTTGRPTTALRVDESSTTVDWGAIANFSWRVGSGNKLGLKNIYTKSAEENLANGNGLVDDNDIQYRYYGAEYIERDLFQSQLSGEHLLSFLLGSRFEWKGTYAKAIRDEPDNRQARYTGAGPGASLSENSAPTNYLVRYLKDRILTGQGDLSVPFGLRHPGDAQLKFGGLYRDKNRDFEAAGLRLRITSTPEAAAAGILPPEQAFSPENMGTVFFLEKNGANQTSTYTAVEHLTSMYGMLDVPLLPFARLVGGLRVEDWRLYVNTIVRNDSTSSTIRDNRDYLWSANLTLALTNSMNLRFAGFRSITRPDPRDLSLDQYTPVGSECAVGGDTTVVESKIINGDARWEFYPRSGELFAVSGFYKRFTNPLVEVVAGNGGSGCLALPANAERATSYGMELEARRGLDFLPGTLRYLSVGVNATFLSSSVELDPVRFGPKEKGLDLQGQSPFLLNASLSYTNPVSRSSLSVLLNYFGDRVARYGGALGLGAIPPNVIEKGRYSLDAKATQEIGNLRLSIGGTNLTNRKPRFIVEGTSLVTRTATIGTSWTVGLSYDVY